MYDRNLSIYMVVGSYMHQQVMSNMPHPYPELAERLYFPSSWGEYFNISKYHLLRKESIALLLIFPFAISSNNCRALMLYQLELLLRAKAAK